MIQSQFDVAVIGSGIAGLSVAATLAQRMRVCVLERENQPAYHSTGRSVAIFSELYGSDLIRSLTRASRDFYTADDPAFAEYPLLDPCGALFIARADQAAQLSALSSDKDVERVARTVSSEEACRLCPVLRPDYVAGAVYDPSPAVINVGGLIQGYGKELRRRGGTLVTDVEVEGISYRDGVWILSTRGGAFAAPLIINAAGAWADEIAALAGVQPVGLQPCRRTVALVEANANAVGTRDFVVDIEEQFYFRQESGGILLSPGDETPSAPTDAQPEELDVATAIDRVSRATTLTVQRVRTKWAGLRNFVHDRNPVVGFDADRPGFFWLAAQGGYGIQTAPAMAKLAAALVAGDSLPTNIGPAADWVRLMSPSRIPQRSAYGTVGQDPDNLSMIATRSERLKNGAGVSGDGVRKLQEEALIWDNHACLSFVRPAFWADDLEEYKKAKVDVVSVNVGDADNSLETVIRNISQFRRFLARHKDRFVLAPDVAAIDAAKRDSRVAVTFDVEGAFSIGSDLSLIQLYYDLGVRWMSMVYNRRNLAGSGVHDDFDEGLTALGHEIVREMDRVGLVKCCSHTGYKTAMDVFNATDRPTIFSHSNARAVHDHPRNVTNELLRACAKTGGVTCINGVSIFLGGNRPTAAQITDHIEYIASITGPEHVGIGLDHVFDHGDLGERISSGPTIWPSGLGYDQNVRVYPPAGLADVIEEMLQRRFSEQDVQQILGKNLLRVARAVWR